MDIVKRVIRLITTTLLLLLTAQTAHAFIVNLEAGDNGEGFWGRSPRVRLFSSVSGMSGPELNVNLERATTINFTAINNLAPVNFGGPFTFELFLDEQNTPWTTQVTPHDIVGRFTASLDNFFLDAGDHTLRLVSVNGFTFGRVEWSLTSAVPATELPEPTTITLIWLGLLGFAASRCKSAKSRNA